MAVDSVLCSVCGPIDGILQGCPTFFSQGQMDNFLNRSRAGLTSYPAPPLAQHALWAYGRTIPDGRRWSGPRVQRRTPNSPECTSSVTAREQTLINFVVKIYRNSVRYFQRLSAQSSARKISSPLPRPLQQKSSSKVVLMLAWDC